ncbi:hypothetical protein F4804DRAFT_321235 [Jackrogersella minutella]|nr:hypothetical protein F4804DRAFT_321235 [Jackrogersella minutella]
MHAIYSIVLGLIALSTAQPAPSPDHGVQMDVRSEPSSQWTEALNEIQQEFTPICHNTCMKFFPDEGKDQDNLKATSTDHNHTNFTSTASTDSGM